MDCGYNKHINMAYNDELQDTSIHLPADCVTHLHSIPNNSSTNPIALVNSRDSDKNCNSGPVLHSDFSAAELGTYNGVSV